MTQTPVGKHDQPSAWKISRGARFIVCRMQFPSAREAPSPVSEKPSYVTSSPAVLFYIQMLDWNGNIALTGTNMPHMSSINGLPSFRQKVPICDAAKSKHVPCPLQGHKQHGRLAQLVKVCAQWKMLNFTVAYLVAVYHNFSVRP